MKAGKRKVKDIRRFLEASYQEEPPEKIDDWILDKDLTTKTAKVYYNPKTKEAVVAHRGTKGVTDWANNLAYLTGTYDYTPRYKEGKSVQDKAEQKYGKKNISTLGHSQGAVIARKTGSDTKEVINVNPAYAFEIPKKNEYNIRSSSDIVSSLYDPVSKAREVLYPSYSKKHDITIPSQSVTDILGEHKYNILERLGDREIGVGAGVNFSSNNIRMYNRRASALGYSGDDIDWTNNNGAVGTPYINQGKNPIGVVGGLNIGRAFKKAFNPVKKAFSDVGHKLTKAGEAINPMTYALKSKGITKAMKQSGDLTQNELLPAVVSAGKPVFDATAMAASTALTGNPVLGKVAANTLWKQMVEKKGFDPRKRQRSQELGELSSTFGQAAAKPMKASLGGSIWKEFKKRDKQRRKVGGTRKQDVVTRLNQLRNVAQNIIENEDIEMPEDETLDEDFGNLQYFLSDAYQQQLMNEVNNAPDEWDDDDNNFLDETEGWVSESIQNIMNTIDIPLMEAGRRGGTRKQEMADKLNNLRQMAEYIIHPQSRIPFPEEDDPNFENDVLNFNQVWTFTQPKKQKEITRELDAAPDDWDTPNWLDEQEATYRAIIEDILKRNQIAFEGHGRKIGKGRGRKKGGSRRDELEKRMKDLKETAENFLNTPDLEDEGGNLDELTHFTRPAVQSLYREVLDSPQYHDWLQSQLDEMTEAIDNLSRTNYPEENPDTDLEDISDEEPEGAGRKKKINFDKVKWGTFTRMFNDFKKEHPRSRVKDLSQFANYIIKNKKKFSDKALKKAHFYNNVLKGGASSEQIGKAASMRTFAPQSSMPYYALSDIVHSADRLDANNYSSVFKDLTRSPDARISELLEKYDESFLRAVYKYIKRAIADGELPADEYRPFLKKMEETHGNKVTQDTTSNTDWGMGSKIVREVDADIIRTNPTIQQRVKPIRPVRPPAPALPTQADIDTKKQLLKILVMRPSEEKNNAFIEFIDKNPTFDDSILAKVQQNQFIKMLQDLGYEIEG